MPSPPPPPGLQPGLGLIRPQSAAVCYIKSDFGVGPDGLLHQATGTGFLYRNDGGMARVLTAAHNLFNPQLQRPAQWIKLMFERIGQVSLATRDAKFWRVPPQFAASDAAPPAFDFGVVRLNPLGDDRFAPIPIGVSAGTATVRRRLSGYPNEPPLTGTGLPCHCDLTAFPVSSNNYGYSPQLTYIGMSGGPLIASTSADPTLRAWGLHIRGDDGQPARAVRFSQPVMDMIAMIE